MAIFKRRKPRDFLKKLREALWPSQGWRRTISYYRHRIFRTGDSTYRIAAGLASGAAVSWSPFLGTHFVQAIFLSWLLRANLLAGFAGTALGNPTTFPVMFWISYSLGAALCGLIGLGDAVALPPGMDFEWFAHHPMPFLAFLFHHPLKLLLPLTLGGYLCALLCWPVAYAALYFPVRAARAGWAMRYARRRRK